MAETGVDGLAVAVGSSHATIEKSARVDMELIAQLRAAAPPDLGGARIDLWHGCCGSRPTGM